MNTGATGPGFLKHQGLRLMLFGGKGGVGKTTCACATASQWAKGFPERRFLLVSTDPAHSLRDSLAGPSPFPNLTILEMAPQESLRRFKNAHAEHLRQIALRGTFLDDEDVGRFLDLSLPGLDELMAFLEISAWAEDRTYDCIVVDTAPTGHTMRLLAMPELIRKWLEALDALLAKHRYMKRIFSPGYCRDELDRFLESFSCSIRKMEALLHDPRCCRFIPVMLAEALSVHETTRLVRDLECRGIPVTDIVVNMLYPENSCMACADGRSRQAKELRNIFRRLNGYVLWGVPLHPEEVRGPHALETFWEGAAELTESASAPLEMRTHPAPRVEASAAPFASDLAFLLLAGKGGVGKTTLACATALRMARDLRGKEILLFSTDPAHSLSACLELTVGPAPTRVCPGLTAMEVDAEAEFDALKRLYQEELASFFRSFLRDMDLPFDREAMERIVDLSPPGLDEVMALTRVMGLLAGGEYDVFILDSAPTGHLIRLLELPELIDQWLKVFFGLFLKYRRLLRLPRVSSRLVEMSGDLKRLRTLLCDPERSALYAVSILTEMAFQETRDLVAACARMGLDVPMILLNLATPRSACPLCSRLHRRQTSVREKFQRTFGERCHTLIYRSEEPRGLERLGILGEALYQPLRKEEAATCAL